MSEIIITLYFVVGMLIVVASGYWISTTDATDAQKWLPFLTVGIWVWPLILLGFMLFGLGIWAGRILHRTSSND